MSDSRTRQNLGESLRRQGDFGPGALNHKSAHRPLAFGQRDIQVAAIRGQTEHRLSSIRTEQVDSVIAFRGLEAEYLRAAPSDVIAIKHVVRQVGGILGCSPDFEVWR